jgi:uncharacterized membrane protein
MSIRFLKSQSLYASFFFTVVSLSVLACSSSDDTSSNNSPIDCSKSVVPTFSQVSGLKKCVTCHSSSLSGVARSDAPASINYDTYTAAKAEALKAVDEVESDSMPPAGNPALTEAEISALKIWASCGTPE